VYVASQAISADHRDPPPPSKNPFAKIIAQKASLNLSPVMFSLFRGKLPPKQGGIFLGSENKQLAPKKGAQKGNQDSIDFIDSCTDTVVSGTECTGLVPTPPESEQEEEAYTDLYTIPKPDTNKERDKLKKDGKN
jgi:hypothetical protein